MGRYYLVSLGFPYYAVVTDEDAAKLFESVPPEQRRGTLSDGFEYWEPLENGRGQLISFTAHAEPITLAQLPVLRKRLGPFVTLPEGFAL
jgi:hypothetical protein